MNLINCTLKSHGEAILSILNEAIINTTALYDYQPRTILNMQTWFAEKERGNFPVIGMENTEGQLLGFATYGTFRHFAAYQHTVEHSIYTHTRHRNSGTGTTLLTALIARAQQQNLHTMIGVIDAKNEGSIRFHERMGFTHVGTLREVGFKFDRWLDVALHQRIL